MSDGYLKFITTLAQTPVTNLARLATECKINTSAGGTMRDIEMLRDTPAGWRLATDVQPTQKWADFVRYWNSQIVYTRNKERKQYLAEFENATKI